MTTAESSQRSPIFRPADRTGGISGQLVRLRTFERSGRRVLQSRPLRRTLAAAEADADFAIELVNAEKRGLRYWDVPG